jgi:ankyrin repeat protein
MFMAVDGGDAETVRRLAPGAKAHLDACGPEGDTLLHCAAIYGFGEVVEALLAAGADPTIRDDNGGTPLVRWRAMTLPLKLHLCCGCG